MRVVSLQIPTMLLGKDRADGAFRKIEIDDELAKGFYAIHQSVEKKSRTPKRFLVLLETFRDVFLSKEKTVGTRQQHLK